MDTLTNAQREVVRTAVLAGRRANPTAANRIILPTGQGATARQRRYVILSTPDGELTAQGELYYHLTREHQPDRRFDYNQIPARRGESEYARDRSGREVKLRTLKANGEYTYTPLGRIFFRLQQVEHIVHIPVIIEGTRANGTPYRREDYLPFDNLSVERILSSGMDTEAQRFARVRTAALQALQIRTLRGRPVLLEVSDETYFYDRNRPWRISSLTTTPHAGGDPQVHAALNRPMGGLGQVKNPVELGTSCLQLNFPQSHAANPVIDGTSCPLNHRVPQSPHAANQVDNQVAVEAACLHCYLVPLLSSSFVPHAEHCLAEAWVVKDDKLCVIRQLAALLGESDKDLIDEFDRLLQREWQHEGLSPNDVKLFCQDRSLPYYCLGSGLLDSWQPENPKGRSVAFATWDGHAYFYKTARVVSEWSATAPLPLRSPASSLPSPSGGPGLTSERQCPAIPATSSATT